MKNAIYLSPVPLHSPAQRPHHFVEWLHQEFNTSVIWVNPYPSRLLRFSDIKRLKSGHHLKNKSLAPIWTDSPWLQVLNPSGLPIEPLPGGSKTIGFLQKKLRKKLKEILVQEDCWLIIGKPSGMAKYLCESKKGHNVLYDVMDDIPEFMKGVSKRWAIYLHDYLVSNSKILWGSSENIFDKLNDSSKGRVKLVKNGMHLPEKIISKNYRDLGERLIIGYVGTIASWFDFELLIKLANKSPTIDIHVYGPLETNLPHKIPKNIYFLGPVAYHLVYGLMKTWHAGIIPFVRNNLTLSVDPVKYYEYRACGLPVLSTMFGEMPAHAKEDNDLWDICTIDFSLLDFNIRKWHQDRAKLSDFNELPKILNRATWSYRFQEGAEFCGWYEN